MSSYFISESLANGGELTICNRAHDCEHTHCKHNRPSITRHMLGLTGNCTDRNSLFIEIIAANADKDPNMAFKIKKSKS